EHAKRCTRPRISCGSTSIATTSAARAASTSVTRPLPAPNSTTQSRAETHASSTNRAASSADAKKCCPRRARPPGTGHHRCHDLSLSPSLPAGIPGRLNARDSSEFASPSAPLTAPLSYRTRATTARGRARGIRFSAPNLAAVAELHDTTEEYLETIL